MIKHSTALSSVYYESDESTYYFESYVLVMALFFQSILEDCMNKCATMHILFSKDLLLNLKKP